MQTHKTYTFSAKALLGKDIVQIESQKSFGRLVDIFIEPNLLEVGAILTNQGYRLARPVETIPSKEISIENQGYVFVGGFKLVEQPISSAEKWLSVSGLIGRQKVMTTGGTSIGRLDDIQLDNRGRVVSYQLDWDIQDKHETFYQFAKHGKLISVIATHALDSQVLIVNEDVLIEQTG